MFVSITFELIIARKWQHFMYKIIIKNDESFLMTAMKNILK